MFSYSMEYGIPLKTLTAQETARKFDFEWLCRYPRPSTVSSDNGKQFVFNEFAELLQSYGIHHHTVPAFQPSSNGLVERINLTIGNALRLNSNQPITNLLIQSISWSIRATSHRVLNCSPSEMVFGSHMLEARLINDKDKVLKVAQEKKKKQSSYDIERQNDKRIDFKFEIGKKVFIKSNNPNKLENRFNGPYLIKSILRNNTVQVDMGTHPQILNIRKQKPLHEPEKKEKKAECRKVHPGPANPGRHTKPLFTK
ncbi:hypothetical protein O9G_005729 [Rozella allomycis CSF55]|uniref:Integrase catalytic domain-containing protein n=1 Tax=Rozella allomycis (strain CSF55) TaxID=988480 RepID=A0A075ATX7_ROZAC|nr:hypothetical protein O9G_005729 [Rozella allomycis CSF55]|eukprot:EPZ33718.1 hypothetical protein O9G_005729 [Rozella allomycis CSF55]